MSLIIGHDPLSGAGGAGGAGAGGQSAGAGQQQPPPGSIAVSPEDMAAINRLASLGFPKSRCAEAFFACDKNEEFAANFLFEAGAEDEDIATQNAIAASAQEVIGGQPNAQPANNEAQPVAQNNAEESE